MLKVLLENVTREAVTYSTEHARRKTVPAAAAPAAMDVVYALMHCGTRVVLCTASAAKSSASSPLSQLVFLQRPSHDLCHRTPSLCTCGAFPRGLS